MSFEETTTIGISDMLDYGALGILILILISAMIMLWKYFVKMEKEHRIDRKDWLEETQRREDRTLAAYEKNTTVMTELKTMIASKR